MKVALIYSFKESSWFSCTVINKNIRKAYDKLFGEENIIHIHYGHDRLIKNSDIKLLIEEQVEKLIFIDHKPTPINFLEKFIRINNFDEYNPDYIIHVFGDYPLYLKEWRSVNEILEGKSVKYICASKKQKLFLEKFVVQKDIIFICPFPVNNEQFKLDNSKRANLRSKYDIDEDSKVFLFTGRLSYQKRIIELIQCFKKAIETNLIKDNSRLVIIGEFDNLGFPYLNQTHIEGEYFRQVDRQVNNDKYKDNIVFTGSIDNYLLNDYYNMADYYYSLSTYHDEDYGMSVAEAGCSGLPLILTNWAGYHSFKISRMPEACELVNVELTSTLPTFKSEDVQKAIEKMTKLTINKSEVSKHYIDEFSVEACAKKLEGIIEAKVLNYECGTDLMIQLTNKQFMKGNLFLMSESSNEFNDLYKRAYDVYAE